MYTMSASRCVPSFPCDVMSNLPPAHEPSPNQRRGSHLKPANPYLSHVAEFDPEHFEHDPESRDELRNAPTVFISDVSKSIISENNSPDLDFRFSLNPYRGCEHGCSYCYARPSHEYLGFNAGLDFETKIHVKHSAPELFREWLSRDSWTPTVIAFSGITDCYQPAERNFQLTRRCVEVACESHQPISIITKNALVVRDLDLLANMAQQGTVHVSLSITSLDANLTRVMEPRTSIPAARLRAVTALADAGIPTRVMIAPVIPGLNDSEIPALLRAARDAGARSAGYILLRLPTTVAPVFLEWLDRTHPTHRSRVESLVRSTREGKLNGGQFGERMRGQGALAEQIANTFRVFSRKYGLAASLPPLTADHFEPPRPKSGQLRLF